MSGDRGVGVTVGGLREALDAFPADLPVQVIVSEFDIVAAGWPRLDHGQVVLDGRHDDDGRVVPR